MATWPARPRPFAFMYSHGMATLAMSEAYAMTGDKRLQPAVQAAINYTLVPKFVPRVDGDIGRSKRQANGAILVSWAGN